jgi:hypothetical protein
LKGLIPASFIPILARAEAVAAISLIVAFHDETIIVTGSEHKKGGFKGVRIGS